MNTPIHTTASARPGATASSVLPQRKAPAPQQPQRQPFRVLQTSRAPAQLSLFLRPGL
ncbi:MAG: hypothetical protein H7Y61_18160 [Rhizobiales bacterium]|nr:hypothetical protein [Rhizobacter sp.]